MENKYYVRGSSEHPDRVANLLMLIGNVKPDEDTVTDCDTLYAIDSEHYVIAARQGTLLYEMLVEYGIEIPITFIHKFEIGDSVTYKGCPNFTVIAQRIADGKPKYTISASHCDVTESELSPSGAPQHLSQMKPGRLDCGESRDKVHGYFVTSDGDIIEEECGIEESCTTFHSRKLAESALAMAKISQLMEQPAYGGCVPQGEYAEIISVTDCSNTFVVGFKSCRYSCSILRFHTREQAELFCQKEEKLIKQYLMLE